MSDTWIENAKFGLEIYEKKKRVLYDLDLAEIHRRNECLSAAATLYGSLFTLGFQEYNSTIIEICAAIDCLLDSAKKNNDYIIRVGSKPDKGWADAMSGKIKFWAQLASNRDIDLLSVTSGLKSALENSKILISSQRPHIAGLLYTLGEIGSLSVDIDRRKEEKYIKDDSGRYFWKLYDILTDRTNYRSRFENEFSSLVKGEPMNLGDGTILLEHRLFAAFCFHYIETKQCNFYTLLDYIRQ